jgi:hypothetical protein
VVACATQKRSAFTKLLSCGTHSHGMLLEMIGWQHYPGHAEVVVVVRGAKQLTANLRTYCSGNAVAKGRVCTCC